MINTYRLGDPSSVAPARALAATVLQAKDQAGLLQVGRGRGVQAPPTLHTKPPNHH